MRLHIVLDDDLVSAVDEMAGTGGRSAFVREAVAGAVDRRRRLLALRRAAGTVPDFGDHLGPGWLRVERLEATTASARRSGGEP